MVSRKTRIRLEGVKQIGKTAARQISPIDKLYDAKEGSEGVYRLLKGKNPPSLGDWFDREQKRRERALDRMVERMSRR